jgi:Mrp family chromosome partitioning ATPase/capsular polysaccharide biosynthesis protein
MDGSLSMNETTEATAILAPLWKRKWLILVVAILVACGTYVYYKREAPLYQTSTELNLNAGAEEQGAVSSEKGKGKKAGSAGSGLVQIINSPLVRDLVGRRLRSEHTAVSRAAQRGTAKAKAAEKSQFLTITAEAETPKGAALLANTVAEATISRQQSNYERGIKQAMATTRKQLQAVELELAQPTSTTKGRKTSHGSSTSATLQAANLSTKLNQYESEISIVGIKQITRAKGGTAHLLSPMPKKNAIFGFVLGLFLASVGAYFLSRFDRRLRTLTAIEAIFETHILAALPTVKRPIVRRTGQLAPAKALSEPLRRLHTGLQLLDVLERDRGAVGEHDPGAASEHVGGSANGSARQHRRRSILFLSPDAGDGKSTVIAGLALVQRESDEQVAVVEADFRRPVQARLLNVTGSQGLADVLAGTLTLDDALQAAESAPADLSSNSRGAHRSAATMVAAPTAGTLSVLVGGAGVPNPPALLASRAMTGLLRSLAEEFDYTLIDAPSPLLVSDVMPLLPVVDGIVIVVRVGHTREISARRLMQILTRTPSAPVLGVVANDVSRADLERYGFYSTQRERRWLGKLFGR